LSFEKAKRIMVIGAHPDDCELRTGGTAIKLVKSGHKVKFVSATNGDTGHYEMGGGQLAKVRMEEMMKSTKTAGVECQVLDIHNNEIEPSVVYRRMFIKCIRQFQPELIITHRPNDYHPDHRYTSTLVQDSIFGLSIPNVCPLEPCLKKMPAVMYMHDSFTKPVEFVPDIVIGIDDVMDIKVNMLNCHKSQVYEWLPWINGKKTDIPETDEARIKWLGRYQRDRDGVVAEKYRQILINRYGEKGKGITAAEAFEISEYGARLSKEDISSMFPFL